MYVKKVEYVINTQFELYKLKRELLRHGIDVVVRRQIQNVFGEPDGKPKVVGTLCGLYHEQNSNIQITTGDTVQVRTKKIPMLLCVYDDVEALSVKPGDWFCLNGKIFNVTGVVNVQEWNLIADVSLEVVDNGV